jgi:hypothetical protein
VLPDAGLKPLEELFRARVITFLVDKGLLPPERANMLRGRVHSGFNVRSFCPKCQNETRIVALIDDRDLRERILRHLGLWQQGVRGAAARAPPGITHPVIAPPAGRLRRPS